MPKSGRRQADRTSSADELLTENKKGVPVGTPFGEERRRSLLLLRRLGLGGRAERVFLEDFLDGVEAVVLTLDRLADLLDLGRLDGREVVAEGLLQKCTPSAHSWPKQSLEIAWTMKNQ